MNYTLSIELPDENLERAQELYTSLIQEGKWALLRSECESEEEENLVNDIVSQLSIE